MCSPADQNGLVFDGIRKCQGCIAFDLAVVLAVGFLCKP